MRMILFRERQRMEIVPLENGHIEAAAEMFVDKLCGLRKSAPALPETMLDPRRAAALLESRGQPALAQIARRHMLHQALDAKFAPRTWEEKLVYFADKLVEGSRVATVEERLNSLRQRYPQHVQTTNAAAPLILRMQEELCAVMGFPVEELHGRLVAAMRGEG